jgi:hypothetical protein
MKRLNQKAEINILLIPLILVTLLLFGAVGFGVWAYSSRQDYKYHTDQKVDAAVTEAKQDEATAKDKEFVQKEKYPLRTYKSPEATGSVTVKYPKTWSAYVDDTGNGSIPTLNGYFYPKVVPSIDDQTKTYALRIQLQAQSYNTVLQQFLSQVKQGTAKVSPYKPENVSGVIGSRVDGQITPTKKGSMIVLPLRSQTLEIWTESSQFEKDFDNIILHYFKFSP